MKRIFKWIPVWAIGVICLTGCQPKWEEYRSDEWGYSVLMPRPYMVLTNYKRGDFHEGNTKIETPHGELPAFCVSFLDTRRRMWECRVTCGSLTTNQNQQFTGEEFIDFFLEQTWSGWSDDEVYRKEISVEGLKGLEYQFAAGRGQKSLVVTERILVGNDRFYVLNYSRAFSRRAPKKKIERFFNSFHLIPRTQESGSQEAQLPGRYEDVPIVDYYKIEKKPQVTSQHTPVYPEKAQNEGHEGTVFVNALVGPYGHVIEVEISQGSGWEELDDAALEAARHWTFTPGEQRGTPVKVWVKIPFTFKL